MVDRFDFLQETTVLLSGGPCWSSAAIRCGSCFPIRKAMSRSRTSGMLHSLHGTVELSMRADHRLGQEPRCVSSIYPPSAARKLGRRVDPYRLLPVLRG